MYYSLVYDNRRGKLTSWITVNTMVSATQDRSNLGITLENKEPRLLRKVLR